MPFLSQTPESCLCLSRRTLSVTLFLSDTLECSVTAQHRRNFRLGEVDIGARCVPVRVPIYERCFTPVSRGGESDGQCHKGCTLPLCDSPTLATNLPKNSACPIAYGSLCHSAFLPSVCVFAMNDECPLWTVNPRLTLPIPKEWLEDNGLCMNREYPMLGRYLFLPGG